MERFRSRQNVEDTEQGVAEQKYVLERYGKELHRCVGVAERQFALAKSFSSEAAANPFMFGTAEPTLADVAILGILQWAARRGLVDVMNNEETYPCLAAHLNAMSKTEDEVSHVGARHECDVFKK